MTAPTVTTRNLRDRGAANFHAALARVLTVALDEALDAEDHPKAISVINRAFAEGTTEMGCELLCHASEKVGAARTWTVQLAPLNHLRQRPVSAS